MRRDDIPEIGHVDQIMNTSLSNKRLNPIELLPIPLSTDVPDNIDTLYGRFDP